MFLHTTNPAYALVYHGCRAFVQTFGALEVSGWKNIPKGGCVIAGNHQSMIDPPLLGGTLDHEVYYFARKTLFDNPLFGGLIRNCNAIPIDRDSGADISAFKKVFSIIKAGHGLVLFPEGTRSHDGKLQEPKGGPGLIACKMKAPVVPVRIYGARDILPRGSRLPRPGARVSVVVGKPLYPRDIDAGAKDPDQAMKASRRIMDAIAALPEPDFPCV